MEGDVKGAGEAARKTGVPADSVSAQLIYEATNDAMWVMRVDADDRFVVLSINPAYTALTGLPAEAMVGKTPQELLSGADLEHVLERHRAAVRERRPIRYEESIVVGRRVTAETTLTPVFDASGRCSHILGATRDISERKAAEREKTSLESQLREARNSEAMGTLATAIAQEFSNLLALIQGHIDVARRDGRRSAKVLKSLASSTKVLRHAHDITKQILAFRSTPLESRRATSLPQLAQEAVRMLRTTLPADRTLDCHEIGETPPVFVDAPQILQVIISLGIRASRSLDGAGGAIRVSVAEAAVADETVRAPGASFASVTVASAFAPPAGLGPVRPGRAGVAAGPSAAAEDAEMEFVRRVVSAHHGALTGRTDASGAASYTIYLPVALPQTPGRSEDRRRAAPAGERCAQPGPRHRVMYIDDHKWLLPLAERLLGDHGIEMRGFVDPQAALDELHARGDQYAVVVTDYKMPKVTGLDIARAVKAAQPGMPVLIVSAYLSETVQQQARRAGADTVIFKTAMTSDLVPAVAQLIERSARGA